MLLTIKTTHSPATDLGFLLHKHPDHIHTREFPFGTATVFYPLAVADACTATKADHFDSHQEPEVIGQVSEGRLNLRVGHKSVTTRSQKA